MNDIVKFDTDRGEVTLSPQIIREYFCRSASDQEIGIFLRLCQYQKLNPFLRQAHLIKYGSQPASMVIGWHVFLERAERNPNFNGYEVDVFDIDDKPFRGRSGQSLNHATAKVYRKDRTHPIIVTVLFEEYCLTDDKGTPRASWAKIPATMIRKVALEQALRESFTKEFEGLYGPEEMGVQDPDALPTQPIVQVTKFDDTGARVVDISVDSPPEPDEAEIVEPTKPRVIAPFAVVKYLTDLHGAAWQRVRVGSVLATQHYFGKVLNNTVEMAALALHDPEAWNKGAQLLIEDVKRAKSK